MNSNQHPVRVPINFFTRNEEVRKGFEFDYAGSKSGGTDYAQTEDVPKAAKPYFDARIADREEGWVVFRRDVGGQLDIDYAVSKVVDIIHIAKLGVVPLTEEQQSILGCIFPETFYYVAGALIPSVLRTTLRISMLECHEIAVQVAGHLADEIDYAHSVRGR